MGEKQRSWAAGLPGAVLWALLFLAIGAGASAAAPDKRGDAVVTVTGSVTRPNRPPFESFQDGYFAHLNLSFDRAHAFSRDDLRRLGMHRIVLRYPNWPKAIVFRGPTLGEVLAAAGATGRSVTVRALDGYGVQIPAEVAARSDVILAVEADGQRLGLGGRGPAWLVCPKGTLPDQDPDTDSGLVWAVFHIAVE